MFVFFVWAWSAGWAIRHLPENGHEKHYDYLFCNCGATWISGPIIFGLRGKAQAQGFDLL